MSVIENKLNAHYSMDLPAVAKPVAAYVPAVRTGNLIVVSGQLPMRDGKLMATGRVGSEVTPEQAAEMARVCALNALAAVKDLAGSLDNVTRIVRVGVFVASADDFHAQPGVANGASELFVTLFGEIGKHARAAVGVNALPLNAPVEVELMVEVAEQ